MRRYGVWGGCPSGQAEDTTRCIAQVMDRDGFHVFYQCLARRGKGPDGLYCGTHARQLAMGRMVYVPRDIAAEATPE